MVTPSMQYENINTVTRSFVRVNRETRARQWLTSHYVGRWFLYTIFNFLSAPLWITSKGKPPAVFLFSLSRKYLLLLFPTLPHVDRKTIIEKKS